MIRTKLPSSHVFALLILNACIMPVHLTFVLAPLRLLPEGMPAVLSMRLRPRLPHVSRLNDFVGTHVEKFKVSTCLSSLIR